MLYVWSGKEEPLGAIFFTATSLRIYTLEEVDGVLKASGQIETMDYAEGHSGGYMWVAEAPTNVEGQRVWSVQRDPDRYFSWTDQSGRPMFTLSRIFDDAIEAFVKKHLEAYMAVDTQTREIVIAESATTYSGEIVQYTGSCVCDQLFDATLESPFPWEELTEGGKYPRGCFACSCERNWWNYNPERGLWAPVLDPALFSMLKMYNGDPQQPVGSLGDGFYLVQTLRNRGYIPIG